MNLAKFEKFRPGIIICVIATLFYASGGVSAALLIDKIGMVNLVMVRCLIQAALPIGWLFKNPNTLADITKKEFFLLMVCGIFLAVAGTMGNLSFSLIPLSDAVTIFNTQSIFVVIISQIWLKEKAHKFEILIVISVIFGVFLISEPEFVFGQSSSTNQKNPIGYGTSILVALLAGIMTCIVRKVNRLGTTCIIILQALSGTFTALIISIFYKSGRDPESFYEIAVLLVMGLTYTIARGLITASLTMEKSTIIAVAATTEVAWSLMYQVTIFQIYPSYINIIGLLVVSMSLVLLGLKDVILAKLSKFIKVKTLSEKKPLLTGIK